VLDFKNVMAETLKINTTQNVRLNFEVASLGDRIAACIIDQCIIVGYYFLFILSAEKLFGGMTESVYIIMLIVGLLYHLLFEIFNNGRSIGKMVMRTRVIRMDGTEPHIGDFFLRWLLGLIEVMGTNGAIALFAYLFGGKGQRIGDMAAGTTVAKLKQRVTLEQTLFEETKPDYKPAYPQVETLTDLDIETIREVLIAKRQNYSIETILLIEKTKSTLETKLGIKSSEQDSVAFLERLIRDFSYLTGKE
jgi:uncharacterized RDD family membrane protein YckC